MKNYRPVVITTTYRGVFFGYVSDATGETIKLKNARNCVYWPATQRGFVGLASEGPLDGARVGPAVDMELRGVTAVLECTKEAVKRWELGSWKS